MGKLRRSKIVELRKLYDEEFTQVEAAEKTGVGRSTVGSYFRRWDKEKKETQPPTPLPLGTLNALAKAFFDLLSVWAVAPYLDEDSVGDLVDDLAYGLLSQLTGSNPDIKTLVVDNPYLRCLKEDVLNFQIPDSQLDPALLKRRQKWLGLLKKFPESLKSLV